jgi:putative ABC transport system permease protein
MIKNYLIVAWRNLLRNKVISMLNISGLALGLPTELIWGGGCLRWRAGLRL